MFFQVDRRLGVIFELKLSSEIPLAKPKPESIEPIC